MRQALVFSMILDRYTLWRTLTLTALHHHCNSLTLVCAQARQWWSSRAKMGLRISLRLLAV